MLENKSNPLEEPVEFSLYDTEGNLVTLSQLRGAPVVILVAESWCGGCQVSGYRMTELYHKYESNNVHFLTVIPSEGIPQLIDYKNHGRNEFPILTGDEKIYSVLNLEMWCPQHVIVNSEGFIKYKGILVGEKTENALLKILEDDKTKVFSGSCSEGICKYPFTESKFVERNPRMAVDDDNTIYVVYTSNEQGNNDIYLRMYVNGLKEVKTSRITKSLADDCWPDILIDKSRNVWVVWLSNKDGFYNIYSKYFNKGVWSEEFKITNPYVVKRIKLGPLVIFGNRSLNGNHIEDAATPRLGMEDDGTVWVTYGRWNTQYTKGIAYSLDREVYATYFDGQKWADEMQVSPTESGMMESWDDHFFPSVVANPSGGMFVSWVWDIHTLYKKNEYFLSYAPSIAYRTITKNGKVGKVKLFGFRGLERINHPYAEYYPELAIDVHDNLHCVWTKGVRSILANSVINNEPKIPDQIATTQTSFTPPKIIEDREGSLYFISSTERDSKNVLFVCELRGCDWSDPIAIEESTNTIRFPNAIFDNNNELWISYIAYSEKSCNLVVKKATQKK